MTRGETMTPGGRRPCDANPSENWSKLRTQELLTHTREKFQRCWSLFVVVRQLRDRRADGPRTVADARHGALNPASGGPRSTADGARAAPISFVRWATLMPVNFAARRRRYAGRASRKQSQ